MIKAYLNYFLQCKSISKIDDPFISRLRHSIFDKLTMVDDSDIQDYYRELKLNRTKISVTDLGAGSKKTKSNVRAIKSIAQNASISQKYGRLLVVLIQEFDCKTVMELGTSLGVGTSYLASNRNTDVFTIEGCPNISSFTQQQLKKYTNISYFIGDFSAQLSSVLKKTNEPDLVYIDGNHTYKATIDYFNFFLKHGHSKTILVFDDIHWSKGMEKAWAEIIQSNGVSVSIDLFRMGIVFIDQAISKKHYIIRF